MITGTPKCSWCGQFVNCETAICTFTPDTEFTTEDMDWEHQECIDKAAQQARLREVQ